MHLRTFCLCSSCGGILIMLPPSTTSAFSSCCSQDHTACFSDFIYLDRDLRLAQPHHPAYPNCSLEAHSSPSTEQSLPRRY